MDLWRSEQLVLAHDDRVGLRSVIAIDDSSLGPGLGGVRFRRYPSESAAVTECQRLAAGMTLKNALAGVPFGGAKSVILDGGTIPDRRALMRRFGSFVARTGGAYLPGVDMGTTVDDLAEIANAGVEVSCSQVDPSPWTALGVAAAIRAAVRHVDGRDEIEGIRVLVQGAGHVGGALARELAADGAQIVIADVDAGRAKAVATQIGGLAVAPAEALDTDCDVFAPCAVARVVAAETVARLRCRIIAGAANDTLANREAADVLAQREITYVPDFVANAGGVIQIHALRAGFDEHRLRADVLRIGERVEQLLSEADEEGILPLTVAERRARAIVAGASQGRTGDVARDARQPVLVA